MSSRIDLTYRGHRIVAVALKGLPLAHVYAGDRKVTDKPIEGDTIEAAADAARAWIDACRAAAVAERRSQDIATASEYISFFASHRLPVHQRAMLVAHAASPDRTLSAGELARAAGKESFEFANSAYGKLGRAVAEALDLELPRRADGTLVLTAAVATSADPDWKPIDGQFRWRMHEEVAEALNHLNIR